MYVPHTPGLMMCAQHHTPPASDSVQTARIPSSRVLRRCEEHPAPASLGALAHLNLAYCNNITDYSLLSACSTLATLDLSYTTRLLDMHFLTACTALTTLRLRYSKRVTGINALAACKTLTLLDLTGAPDEALADIHVLQAALGTALVVKH